MRIIEHHEYFSEFQTEYRKLKIPIQIVEGRVSCELLLDKYHELTIINS